MSMVEGFPDDEIASLEEALAPQEIATVNRPVINNMEEDTATH